MLVYPSPLGKVTPKAADELESNKSQKNLIRCGDAYFPFPFGEGGAEGGG